MKSKKFLILAITISFPVILYLFLRFFGQNNYDLPYFFQEEHMECSDGKVSPTFLKSVMTKDSIVLQAIFDQNLTLVIFPDVEKDNQPLINELSRTIQELKKRVKLSLVAVYKDSVNTSNLVSISETTIDNYSLPKIAYRQLIDCQIKLPNANFQGVHPIEKVWPNGEIMVLIDENSNIRGYYNGFETKEVDRLILEVNVLLTKN